MKNIYVLLLLITALFSQDITFAQNHTFSNKDTVTVLLQNGYPEYPSTTVCKHGINKNIPDYSQIYDTINVDIPSYYFGIYDVNVKIDTVFHTWDGDLVFSLRHLSREVTIVDNVGGSGDNFIGTILNDSATIHIASGTAPFTGSFIPTNPLAAFNNDYENPGGDWILKIIDEAAGDTGILKAWCVTISYYWTDGNIHTVTVPSYYALKQNYPNPFNPSTKIEYYIPKAGNVRLTVYDITGRDVAVLVNGFKNPGIYSVDFNAFSFSSGVYFYEIQSGSFLAVKKMILLK